MASNGFNLNVHGKQPLKASTFGHFFLNGNEACAYHSLTLERTYYSTEMHQLIEVCTIKSPAEVEIAIKPDQKDRFRETLQKICDLNILVPQGYEEEEILSSFRPLIFKGPRIRVMVLHVTDFCNLHCRYCFVEGQLEESYCRSMMTQSVMFEAIDFFARIRSREPSRKPPTIVFYGGEPLLNWKVIEAGIGHISSLQKIGSLPANLNLVLITNGTRVTKRIAKRLFEYGVHVAVSLDGPQDVNDAMRVDANGRGSFNQAMRGVSILRTYGVDPTISSVMSEALSKEKCARILEFLLGTLRTRGIGFNHISILPNSKFYDVEYEENYADVLISAQKIISDRYPDTFDRRMTGRIRNFRQHQIQKADCTGCGEQISISPQGDVGICQGYMGNRKTFSNTVFAKDYDPALDPVFQEWSRRSPINMQICLKCAALATCGGGCPRNAESLTGSIWNPDAAFCHFAKKAQEWLIWNIR